MKNLKKLLDTYTRYLNSLKEQGTDIKKNYQAMRAFIDDTSDEWLRDHMLQDAWINALRAINGKTIEIVPNSRIKTLQDSLDEKTIEAVKKTIVVPNAKGDFVIRFSWLPTLYKYFTPESMKELNRMKDELDAMLAKNLVSQEDYSLVNENIFKPREVTFRRERIRAAQRQEEERLQTQKEIFMKVHSEKKS